MTARSIRRAQERKARKEMDRNARKEMERKAQNATLNCEEFAISPAQLSANRANAQLSTGPTSSEGKAKACLNAVKTALTGRTVLLPADDAAEYERHIRGFEEEYAPVGQRESDLVQSIADTWWRLKRIPCLESALFAQGYVEFFDSFEDQDPSLRPGLIQAQSFLKYEKQIRNLHTQESRLFRRYEKERAELRQLQENRRANETAAFEAAAANQESAQISGQSAEPLSNGFEFSTEQIERYLEHVPAHAPAQTHTTTQAQAA